MASKHVMEGSPAAAGYHMPAEWARQDVTWLSWPTNEDTFLFLRDVERIHARFAKTLSGGQRVRILVPDGDTRERAMSFLDREAVPPSAVEFIEIPVVDVWIRDYGPTFVVNEASPAPIAMVNWRFNAWGDKYDDLKLDDSTPARLNERLGLPVFEPGVVMEGGSIDVNGAGCVLTTRQCLLNQNRNPHLDQASIETVLRDYLNVSTVLWLGDGIAGDDTDGHVDDVARFTSARTIACAVEDDPSDENHALLQENYHALQGMVDARGAPFTVVPVPMPGLVEYEGIRYPASYMNFYIGNEVVVVPVFDHANDCRALAIIESLFPGRAVVPIDCTALVYGFGTLHCSSQQQPATGT